jgi:hypothetical protein
MRHKTAERWISDDLDRALFSGRKAKLDRHLSLCSTCRTYRAGLEKIQSKAVLCFPVLPEDYWQARLAALRAGLADPSSRQGISKAPARRVPGFFPWRSWALAGGGSALAAAAVLFFLLLPGRPLYDAYAYALGNPWGAIEDHLPDEAAILEFNQSLESSLSEPLTESASEVVLLTGDQAFLLENLSDEDIRLFNREIALEIGI